MHFFFVVVFFRCPFVSFILHMCAGREGDGGVSLV